MRAPSAISCENGREVIYDAEHFFDGYADDAEYAIETLRAAAAGGANCLVLCDTNGGRLPLEIQEGVEIVLTELSLPVGIHTHNDAGMGGSKFCARRASWCDARARHVQRLR